MKLLKNIIKTTVLSFAATKISPTFAGYASTGANVAYRGVSFGNAVINAAEQANTFKKQTVSYFQPLAKDLGFEEITHFDASVSKIQQELTKAGSFFEGSESYFGKITKKEDEWVLVNNFNKKNVNSMPGSWNKFDSVEEQQSQDDAMFAEYAMIEIPPKN